MTDYYISDTHFGHASIIEFCDRLWKTVEELVENTLRWKRGR